MPKNTTPMLSIGLSILYMVGCASTACLPPPVVKQAPVTASMKEPAPAPGLFSRCLREILELADNQKPISDICSTFLQEKGTK